MIDEILGKVSAYAYAVEKGYTGTETQFAYDLAHAADYASTAGTAAENASESEENAKDSEEAAAQSEGNAEGYAQSAHDDAAAALEAKGQAIAAKNDAVTAKGLAENSATIANSAKIAAAQSEQNAYQFAESAEQDAGDASNSASSASTSSLKSEGFAVGEQNGVPVESGSLYYENNSKYYSEQAAAQLGLVTAEGTRQIGLVTDEGTAQKAAVQEKGEQTLASIPEDYTTLRNDVSSLKSDLNASQGLLIGEGEANVSIWEEGSISGIGGNTANSARIRTKTNQLIGFTQGQLKVSCSSDYEMFFSAYDLAGTHVGKIQTDGQIGTGDGAWLQEVDLINYFSNLFRVVLRNKNDTTATMTVAESSNVLFHGERYAIKTAEGENPTPYVYDEIEIELETGIYDRWNNFTNTGKHSTLSVEKDEKYIIVAQAYSSNDYPVYLLRKGNTIVGYKNIATSQMVQVDLTIPDGADELVINSSRAYISVKKGTPVSAKPYSNWHGKKIAWFGTSIPETSTYNAVLGYPEYVGKLLGATVYNEAVGSSCARRGFRTAESANDPYGWTGMGIAALWNMGSTIAEKNEIISNWESKWRSLTGYNAAMTEGISAKALACSYENKLVQKYIIDNPVDLYVFDHGYNDWKTGDLDMDANDPFDRSTYQGAMNTFIKAVLEANPRARILIVSHYENQERPGLIEMQKGEAEYWNLPFAKLYEHLGWANNRTITTDGYWSNATSNGIWIESGGQEQTLTLKQYHMPDGRHPNTDITGRACMDIAYVLADFINGITPAD